MRILWDPVIPPEVRAAAEPTLDEWKTRLPGWISDLTVSFDQKDGVNCSINVQYEYRRAYLYLHGAWLEQSTDMRREDILHELIHLFLEPMQGSISSLTEHLLKDNPTFLGWVEEEIERGLEASTCDLTNLLLRWT